MSSTTTKQKLDALLFRDKHGLTATIDYASVSRATLQAWRQAHAQRGVAGLADRSKAPHTRRRNWSVQMIKHIRQLRTTHPNLGCEKVRVMLQP